LDRKASPDVTAPNSPLTPGKPLKVSNSTFANANAIADADDALAAAVSTEATLQPNVPGLKGTATKTLFE
jgi:hypothetical protein